MACARSEARLGGGDEFRALVLGSPVGLQPQGLRSTPGLASLALPELDGPISIWPVGRIRYVRLACPIAGVVTLSENPLDPIEMVRLQVPRSRKNTDTWHGPSVPPAPAPARPWAANAPVWVDSLTTWIVVPAANRPQPEARSDAVQRSSAAILLIGEIPAAVSFAKSPYASRILGPPSVAPAGSRDLLGGGDAPVPSLRMLGSQEAFPK